MSAAQLAREVEGRSIRLALRVVMTPPDNGPVGHTDMAMEIGQGLMKEAMLLLRTAGEAEGFTVDIDCSICVI